MARLYIVNSSALFRKKKKSKEPIRYMVVEKLDGVGPVANRSSTD